MKLTQNDARWFAWAALGALVVFLAVKAAMLPGTPHSPSPPKTSARPASRAPDGYVSAGGMPACSTHPALDEFIQASAANDRQWMAQVLLKRGCTLTAPGLKTVRIENVALGIVKVRIFTPDSQDSMVLYTLSENLSAVWK